MTAKKTALKSVAVKAVVDKVVAKIAPHVSHHTHASEETDPPTSYAFKTWNADVTAAAGLRNGMTPAQVHEAIAKVVDKK